MTQVRQFSQGLAICTSGVPKLFGAATVVFALACQIPALSANSVESSVQQARTLAEIGRFEDAQGLLRTTLETNPSNDLAYETLVQVTQTRELTAESAPLDLAKKRLPRHFASLQTSRFVLLSDADAFAVSQHGKWVERTCEEFERFARQCGLRPLPLQHKLVCVLFEQHDHYREFARSSDGVNNPAFTGYYSPRHDRVVFSLQSDEQRTKQRGGDTSTKMLAGGTKVFGFESEVNATHAHDHQTCDESTLQQSAAKCVHETIHQLMFHTRIMAPDTQYPLWICEGLSTAFETDNPEQPFGPDRDFEPRRRTFRKILQRGDTISLRELASLTSLAGKDARLTRAVYHQSYALVTWLCRNHPDQLRNYLRAMFLEPSGKLPASRHVELFEQSFGSVREVEQRWLDHEWAALDAQHDREAR